MYHGRLTNEDHNTHNYILPLHVFIIIYVCYTIILYSETVRKLLFELDPEGVTARQQHRLRRRVYQANVSWQ